MASKASNVVGILVVRRIDDLVLGTPGNRVCLWPLISKQESGVGHYKSILLPADEGIIGSS
jgi:hypothetical protein